VRQLNETSKQEILESDEAINYYYPQISFSPNNYENPLEVQLDYKTLFINSKTTIITSIGYAETKIIQDENVFFVSKSEINSVIHFANQFQYYIPKKDPSDSLAYFQFYLDGLYYNKYTRIYKKVPEILAQVFGIIQPLIILFSLLVKYFSKYNLDNYLIDNFLCFFSKEEYNDNNIIWKYKNFKDFKNIFKNLKYKNEFAKFNPYKKFINVDEKRDLKEKICETDYLHRNKNYQNSINLFMNDFSNRNVKIRIENENNINNQNIEMLNQSNINIIREEDLNREKTLKNLTYSNIILNQNRTDKEILFDSLSVSLDRKNNFPKIGFFDYYFPSLIPKNNINYYSKINFPKILKYF